MTAQRMPIFFIGHGSPMNALTHNPFTRSLERMAALCLRPRAVLCISAHWMTEGTWVTHMERPRTIHDFSGFPQELFDIRYPAPGSPETADLVRTTVVHSGIKADDEMWGLDHGAWLVLRHMYPEAHIPVVQLSLDMARPPEEHFRLGEQLRALREQGILIVGSGNIVHNLQLLRWEPEAQPFDWALEFDEWMKARIVQRDYLPLFGEFAASKAGQLSVPTPDHYLPVLYTLGASDEEDQLRFEYEGIEHASISMRTFSFTPRS